MLDDAIYYSRREAEELTAARQATDLRARQIHAMLADRYGQLAKRALADLPESGFAVPTLKQVGTSPSRAAPRRVR